MRAKVLRVVHLDGLIVRKETPCQTTPIKELPNCTISPRTLTARQRYIMARKITRLRTNGSPTLRGSYQQIGEHSRLRYWPPRLRQPPYADALSEFDPEILAKLLTATKMALFERLLELTGDQDEPDERQDIARAIEVVVSLKAGTS